MFKIKKKYKVGRSLLLSFARLLWLVSFNNVKVQQNQVLCKFLT